VKEEIVLKRMVHATRKIDEEIAPSFEDLLASMPSDPPSASETDSSIGFLPVRILVSAIAACLVVTLSIWIYTRTIERQEFAETPHDQMVRLNQLCDSMLTRIDKSGSASEMDWYTETDTLIPFETLRFQSRTSP